MSEWKNDLRLRLSDLKLEPAREAEIVQELEQHLDDRYAELVAQGQSEQDAHRAAFCELENIEVLRCELQKLHQAPENPVVFGANGGTMLNDLAQDFRYALRMTIKRPWFSLAIILTLGVCIGAVGTTFSAVDAALLRALPFPQPDRLAQVVIKVNGHGVSEDETGQDGYAWDAVKKVKSIDAAVYSGGLGGVNFTSGDVVAYLRQQRVSAGYFRVMGVAPLLGREFTPEEDLPTEGPAVLLLSYDFWRKSFNSNPAVVGQFAQIAGRSYQIIGVSAPGFESKFGAVDVWMPLHPSTQGEGQGLNYEIVARLRPGVSWAEADTEVANLGRAMLKNRGSGSGWIVQPGLENLQQSQSDELRTPLILIMSGALLVLLIGCVNVAAMLLAKGVARRGEIAIRMALGAARSAIVRQLMVENLVFGFAAALIGIGISKAGVAILQNLPDQGSDIGEAGWTMLKSAQLDWRTIGATMTISLAAILLFGLFPAIEAGDIDLKSAATGRGVIGGARTLLRRALPAFQVGIAVFLLIGAGLLARSFAHLWTQTPGFDSANVVSASFSLRDSRYAAPGRTIRLFDESIRQLHQIPGVESVAVAASLPYERALNEVFIKDSDPADRSSWKLSNVIYTTEEFFHAFRIPLLRGRFPTEADRAGAPPIVVVNQAFARKYFPGDDPLGRQIKLEDKSWQIVGIVGDTQQRAGWGAYGPMGAVPCLYTPAAQQDPGVGVPKWIVRTHAPDPALQRQIEAVLKGLDPAIPLTAFQTVDDIKRSAFGWQEFLATAMGIAAVLALLLSIVGTYAMISNAVAERTREFGIRLALGATVAQTIRAAARPGMVCASIGLLAGIIAARLETKVLEQLLWGITPTDFLTFFIVAAGVLMVAMLASVIPALRISRLDPAQTLRQE